MQSNERHGIKFGFPPQELHFNQPNLNNPEKLRILALETSSRQTSVALLEDNQLVAQVESGGQSTSASLIPNIQSLFERVDWGIREVELIAVTKGPGSFTGLRIGITTAKTLAFAAETSIIGMNTLMVIAEQARTSLAQSATIDAPLSCRNLIKTALNAQRQQLFAADFSLQSSPSDEISTQIMDRQAWLDSLQPGQIVTGPGIQPLLSRLEQRTDLHVVSPDLRLPKAETLGRLAGRQAQIGKFDDLWKLQPEYFRPSYAHEKVIAS